MIMAIAISEELFKQIHVYLLSLSEQGDPHAQELLVEMQHQEHVKTDTPSRSPSPQTTPRKLSQAEFSKRLFNTWQELAQDEIGENFWSYPVSIDDIADAMEMDSETLVHYLASSEIDRIQLIQTRGQNYQIGKQKAASLTFHPISHPHEREVKPSQRLAKSGNGVLIEDDPAFKVGDRVRVNNRRPQYANLSGTVSQVISVSCRVQLDNGWAAFLPNHCLDRI
jgi:hypothetical protein